MARVRVGGVWLHNLTKVGGLRWSHRADAGCYEASWTAGLRRTGQATSILRRGARVEVFEGLSRVWYGVLSEPGGVTGECHARGMIPDASRFLALTDNVDAAITAAVADGWDVTYLGDAPTGVATEKVQSLSAAMATAATAASKRATVRADGVLRWEADPTVPSLLVMPGVGSIQRSDDDYATRVVVQYVDSVTSDTPPRPASVADVTVEDAAAAARFGPSTLFVDLTERGLLTAGSVTDFAQGVLTKGAPRLSFAESLTLNRYGVRSIGGQVLTLAHLRAGVMMRLLGVYSPEAGATSQAVDVIVGGTDYTDGSATITLQPLGLAPRTLADIIAATPTRPPIATATGLV